MDENVERGTNDRQGVDALSGPVERERQESTDRVLSAVANEHRRAVLQSLNSTSSRTLEYDALVDRVADRTGEESTAGTSEEHRQRVRIALHHTHLPKLAAAGMIDHEAEAGRVRFVGGELEQDILTLVGSHDVDE